jgi:lysozyme
MATEFEELVLRVRLDDQTAGLDAVNQKVHQLGQSGNNATTHTKRLEDSIKSMLGQGGAVVAGFERMIKSSKELAEIFGTLGGGFAKAGEALGPFVRNVGLAGAGILAIGFAADKSLRSINALADRMKSIGRLSEATGVHGAQIEAMRRTMRESQIDEGEADRLIEDLAKAQQDISRPNSQVRIKLLQGAGLAHRAEMEEMVTRLRAAPDIETFGNLAKQLTEQVYKNKYEELRHPTDPNVQPLSEGVARERAAMARRTAAGALANERLLDLRGELHAPSKEEIEAYEARKKAMDEWSTAVAKLANNMERLKNSFAAILDAATPLLPLIKGLAFAVGVLAKGAETLEGVLTRNPNLIPTIAGILFPNVGPLLFPRKPEPESKEGEDKGKGSLTWEELRGLLRGTLSPTVSPAALPPKSVLGDDDKALQELKDSIFRKPIIAPAVPTRGKEPYVPALHLLGDGGDDKYSRMPMSTNIEDRRTPEQIAKDEEWWKRSHGQQTRGGGEPDDQIKALKENTEQLRRLNEMLLGLTAPAGRPAAGAPVRMEGLGGLPGVNPPGGGYGFVNTGIGTPEAPAGGPGGGMPGGIAMPGVRGLPGIGPMFTPMGPLPGLGTPALPGAATPTAPEAPDRPGTPEAPAAAARGGDGAAPDWFTSKVKKFEGFDPRAKWDYKQFTSGYGTKAGYAGEPITRAEAEKRLQTELASAGASVDKINPNLDPGTRAALTDLVFNSGAGALKGIRPAIASGDTDAIKKWLPEHFRTAGGKELPTLVRRRAEEATWVNNPAFQKQPATREASAPEPGGGRHQVGPGTGAAGSPEPGSGEMGPSQALAVARQHLGEDEIRDESKLRSWFAEKGIKVNPRTTAWCAAFVNRNLAEAGIKGTDSLAAGSFTKWGTGVGGKESVAPGDVGVVRGVSPRTGIEGTHVAFLTGRTEMRNGVEYDEVLGGNQGGTVSGKGGVSTQWRPRSSLIIRRAEVDRQMAEHRVTGTGKLDVNVNAPKGTRVGAEGAGLFKEVHVTRQTQMEPARSSLRGEE